jgi:hypothetical protein
MLRLSTVIRVAIVLRVDVSAFSHSSGSWGTGKPGDGTGKRGMESARLMDYLIALMSDWSVMPALAVRHWLSGTGL